MLECGQPAETCRCFGGRQLHRFRQRLCFGKSIPDFIDIHSRPERQSLRLIQPHNAAIPTAQLTADIFEITANYRTAVAESILQISHRLSTLCQRPALQCRNFLRRTKAIKRQPDSQDSDQQQLQRSDSQRRTQQHTSLRVRIAGVEEFAQHNRRLLTGVFVIVEITTFDQPHGQTAGTPVQHAAVREDVRAGTYDDAPTAHRPRRHFNTIRR